MSMSSQSVNNTPGGTQEYWRRHNKWFDELYTSANWFDRLFRKDVYLRMAVAKQVCSELERPVVLDVGCGSGHVAQSLLTDAGAAEIVGIDFSDSMLVLAKTLFERHGLSGRAEWIQGDIFAADFRGRTFDLVVGLGLFDYVADWKALWGKMLQLAGSAVVASFPSPAFPRSNLRKLRYGMKGCQVFFYTEQDVEWLKRNSVGFSVEDHRGQAGHIIVARRDSTQQKG